MQKLFLRIRVSRFALPLVAIVSGSLTSCSTTESEDVWGEGATLTPGWERVSKAAFNAAFDLQTLIPAAGAMIFAIDDFDQEVSDWAARETPMFQSGRTARKFSDWANVALAAEFGATVLATPSGEPFSSEWYSAKARGLALETTSALVTFGVTEGMKSAVGRTRPDGSDDRSFPSGHTSGAFTLSTLANRNLESIEMPSRLRLAAQTGNIVTASAVGWARVEGRRHFPSDVFAGAAVAYFLNAFIHDAFLGPPEGRSFGFGVSPTMEGGAMASLSFKF
ncbi:MAG: phosphatase PAP2 family protein [Planctomycetota bacterium]